MRRRLRGAGATVEWPPAHAAPDAGSYRLYRAGGHLRAVSEAARREAVAGGYAYEGSSGGR
ncbi:MAG: hypothetical protein OZ921_10850 [Sorangiineae bacterium]|nr:hypothetical protein [Polyangiaceae bacterium]MEB2323005.1 hypothetical protein [Sorangiineae bacterium]